jgi:hypothetical protein
MNTISEELQNWARDWHLEQHVMPTLIDLGFDIADVIVDLSKEDLHILSPNLGPGDLAKFDKAVRSLRSQHCTASATTVTTPQTANTIQSPQQLEQTPPHKTFRCHNCHKDITNTRHHSEKNCPNEACTSLANCPSHAVDLHRKETAMTRQAQQQQKKQQKEATQLQEREAKKAKKEAFRVQPLPGFELWSQQCTPHISNQIMNFYLRKIVLCCAVLGSPRPEERCPRAQVLLSRYSLIRKKYSAYKAKVKSFRQLDPLPEDMIAQLNGQE